ncbi:MAG: hypothetical protein HC890_01435 [Chloroflexaceae bacterium]|nr:hypothetical protein [Chloroflexaceae bacterium]
MANNYRVEQTLTAVFANQTQVDEAVRRLIDQGVDRDHISVLGKNFQSQSRISGFLTKRDVIFGGLRNGALFGSLFGSFLSLLTGVGVLFVPFVGTVVAAGPIGAILLGAATGAIAGGTGGGLASFLATLGMPEEKAAVYETRLQAGEYLVMVEVPGDRLGLAQQTLNEVGGEEIHVSEGVLPRACEGRCNSPADLSPEIRNHLSPAAQNAFIERYNQALSDSADPTAAEQAAWEQVRQDYQEDENGIWSQGKVKVGAM